jgi:hypothetical protein
MMPNTAITKTKATTTSQSDQKNGSLILLRTLSKKLKSVAPGLAGATDLRITFFTFL